MVVCLILLGFAVANAAFRSGGIGPDAWSVSLAFIAAATLVSFGARRSALPYQPSGRVVSVLALLVPAYVAFQLVPLPVPLLQVLSDTRAEIATGLARAAGPLVFAPISINAAETAVHLSRLVGYVLVLLVIQRVARRVRSAWTLALPLLAIAGCEAAWGLTQLVSGARTVPGTYINPNHFANLLAMSLPFALMGAVAILRRGPYRRHIPVSGALFASAAFLLAGALLVAIIASSSRMGFFSAMGSLLVMAVLMIKRETSGSTRRTTFAGLALAGVLALVFLPSDSFVREFSSIPADGRGPIWRDSLSLVSAYPLFGTGLHNYYPGLLPFQTAGLAYSWTEAHNDYLQLVAELGAVGFILPALLVAILFRGALRSALSEIDPRAGDFAVACVASMAAFLFHSVADFNFYVPANAMTFAWVLGLSSKAATGSAGAEPPTSGTASRGRLVRRSVLALGVFAALNAGAWLVYLRAYRGNPRVEAALCRIGICDADRVLSALQREQGVASIAALSPEQVLAFVRRDSANPSRWSDLGDSLQFADRTDEAKEAFGRALELGPRVPFVLYRAAQFHLSIGDSRTSLDLARAAVRSDPERLRAYLGPYEGGAVPIGDVLQRGLPDDPMLLREFLRQRITRADVAGSDATWAFILGKGYADQESAASYVEFLARVGSPEQAWQAWDQFVRSSGVRRSDDDRVFNGDFEADFVPTRFDWRTSSVRGVAADFDREVRRSDGRSLRLRFDGTQNATALGVQQVVYLDGGQYRFQAYVRSEGVTTDEGVGFTITPEGSRQPLATTAALRGTNAWTLVEQVFDAPPQGGLVRVSLTRQRSFRFDNLLAGTIWVDDVSITPVAP